MKTCVLIRNFIWTIAALFGCVGLAQAQIAVTEAQIGCTDLTQNRGNLTAIVGSACNGKFSCSFPAPTPAQYNAAHIPVYGRTFCTQAMEIEYRCGAAAVKSVIVPGDAWTHPPAELICDAPPTGGGQPQNPQMVPVLQGLLQKYRKCILEEYENQVSENDKNKTNPHALGPKRDAAICVAGNTCTRASRQDTYNRLKAQADRGDPTNFETSLEQAILNDCMSCAKHNELHTKLMHCTLECNGNQNWSENPIKFDTLVGPCFDGCKAGVDIEKLVNDVENDLRRFFQGLAQEVGLAGSGNNQSPATGQPSASMSKLPFDLVWDINTGVDANSLPLNPRWRFQVDNHGLLPDFREFCADAILDQRNPVRSKLAQKCTSQAPTVDLAAHGIPCAFGGADEVLEGHLNWALATVVGSIHWSGKDWNDGDLNLELTRPDHAAETILNNGTEYGLHIEFKESETIKDFRSPFWVNFYNGGPFDSPNSSPNMITRNSIEGAPAVVTGLLGLDGVHGGYTELHPVFSLAIRTKEQAVQGGMDRSWAFFLRNSGTEGCCSSLVHQWPGLKKPGDLPGNWTWYFIQLPSPAGATSVSVQTGGSQVWSNASNVTGPIISQDPQWTYLGFTLPDPASKAAVDGEISLHYVVPTLTGAPPRMRATAPVLKPLIPRGDDWEDVRKSIRNPADLKRLDEALRASQLVAVKPRPHTIRLPIVAVASIPAHQRLVGPGHNGVLIRTRAVADPSDAASREQLDQNVRKIIPKKILPVKPVGLSNVPFSSDRRKQ